MHIHAQQSFPIVITEKLHGPQEHDIDLNCGQAKKKQIVDKNDKIYI